MSTAVTDLQEARTDEVVARSHETDVEMTPAMIAAGVEEYALFSSQDPGEWVVPAIYRAMRAAALRNEALVNE
jgi:hypothetical protein